MWLHDVIAVQNNFLENNCSELLKILKGWYRAVDWSKRNKEECLKIAQEKLFKNNANATVDYIKQQMTQARKVVFTKAEGCDKVHAKSHILK